MSFKRFEDMTPEEKQECFSKWVEAKNKAKEDPLEYLLHSLQESLKPYIPECLHEEAFEEVKATLEDCFTTIEELKE